MYLKFLDEELKNGGRVTTALTIDEELLRRMDTSFQPDLAAEDITRDRLEVVEDQESGELHFKSKANQ